MEDTPRDRQRRAREIAEGENDGEMRGRVQRVILESTYPSCAVPPGNDIVVKAYSGHAGQGLKMDTHRLR
jgi:hypothetical protein